MDKDAPFTDVKAGRYYTQAIRWAWAEGIANGITPTRFAPEEPITREQMVTFLARYAASTGKEIASQVDLSSFPDSELISEYAKEIHGMGRGKRHPQRHGWWQTGSLRPPPPEPNPPPCSSATAPASAVNLKSVGVVQHCTTPPFFQMTVAFPLPADNSSWRTLCAPTGSGRMCKNAQRPYPMAVFRGNCHIYDCNFPLAPL